MSARRHRRMLRLEQYLLIYLEICSRRSLLLPSINSIQALLYLQGLNCPGSTLPSRSSVGSRFLSISTLTLRRSPPRRGSYRNLLEPVNFSPLINSSGQTFRSPARSRRSLSACLRSRTSMRLGTIKRSRLEFENLCQSISLNEQTFHNQGHSAKCHSAYWRSLILTALGAARRSHSEAGKEASYPRRSISLSQSLRGCSTLFLSLTSIRLTASQLAGSWQALSGSGIPCQPTSSNAQTSPRIVRSERSHSICREICSRRSSSRPSWRKRSREDRGSFSATGSIFSATSPSTQAFGPRRTVSSMYLKLHNLRRWLRRLYHSSRRQGDDWMCAVNIGDKRLPTSRPSISKLLTPRYTMISF